MSRRRRAALHAEAPSSTTSPSRLHGWMLALTAALLIARPLVPSEEVRWLADGAPFAMAWLLLAGVWALALLRGSPRGVRFGWFDVAVGLFVAWQSVAALVGMTRGAPRPNVNLLWQGVAVGILVLLVRQTFVTARERRALVAAMIALGVALSVDAIYQSGVTLPAARRAFDRDPEAALSAAGIHAPPGSGVRQNFEARLGSAERFATEPFATFVLTNSLAGFLAAWLVLAIGVACFGATRWDATRWTLLGGAGLMLIALLLTRSRTAIAATALGLVTLAAWRFATRLPTKSRRALLFGLPIAAVATLAILLFLPGSLPAAARRSLLFRWEYWQATLAMIADHPLFGVGPGNFKEFYVQYKLPTASEEISDPHNALFEIAATSGLPGLLLFLGLLVVALKPRGAHRDTSLAEEPEESSDLYWSVAGGAAAALLLAWFVRLLSGLDWDPIELVGVGAVLLISWTLLRQWVEQGVLAAGLVPLAAMVLLVNLMAAGGISYPGVSTSLWLLLALAAAGDRRATSGATSRRIGVVALGAAFGLGGLCYLTAYQPVLRASSALNSAATYPAGRASAEQGELLAEAAAADPLSPEAQSELALWHLGRWRQTRSRAALQQAIAHAREAVALHPRSTPALLRLSRELREAHQRGASPEAGQTAVEFATQATEYYPTSAFAWAELALTLEAVGRSNDAQRAASESLRLDEAMPHADKKLEKRLSPESLLQVRGIAAGSGLKQP